MKTAEFDLRYDFFCSLIIAPFRNGWIRMNRGDRLTASFALRATNNLVHCSPHRRRYLVHHQNHTPYPVLNNGSETIARSTAHPNLPSFSSGHPKQPSETDEDPNIRLGKRGPKRGVWESTQTLLYNKQPMPQPSTVRDNQSVIYRITNYFSIVEYCPLESLARLGQSPWPGNRTSKDPGDRIKSTESTNPRHNP